MKNDKLGINNLLLTQKLFLKELFSLKPILLKGVLLFITSMFLFSCDSEEAIDCFQVEGNSIQQEVVVDTFEEITIYNDIKVYLTYGATQKIELETGQNLINDASFRVEENHLHIENSNTCNFFRDYEAIKVYITIPNLTYLRNGSQFTVESTNTLAFNNLTIVSEDAEGDNDYYTNGDFKLVVDAEKITVVNNNMSDYFISGEVEDLQIGFFNGDGRFEAENLVAQDVTIFHRGSNQIIVNPQQSLTGTLYSTGDLISKNNPPTVEIEELYTGKLIFD